MITKVSRKKISARKKAAAKKSPLLSLLTAKEGKSRRRLSEDERHAMVLMLAQQSDALAFDIDRLVPDGSFLQKIVRHFVQTDISLTLPLFQLVMISASWLTQNGAYLEIEGAGRILPTLWTIGLADSGSSKTFASDRVWQILSPPDAAPTVARLEPVSTDAQWIIDLHQNNGAYWFQDEVGKFVHEMNTSTKLSRLKSWMLPAYSHAAIGNRLKGEERKLVIERPFFTFHGLSVLSTWPQDVNVISMMDGWCQRMNYYVAPPRSDSSIFDHFIYFGGKRVVQHEAEFRETWQALCAQPAAGGVYTLSPPARAFLESWWKGLQKSWGDLALPASFLRRIGFSTLRYLMVIQFLLGKSRHPIDIETASLATEFAEFHMESALLLVQSYDQAATVHVRRIANLHASLEAEGKDPSPRNISRRLSKAARAAVSSEMVKEIVEVLNKIEPPPELIGQEVTVKDKANAIHRDWQNERKRLKLNERKRNERRLRELRKVLSLMRAQSTAVDPSTSGVVVDFDAFAAAEKMVHGGGEQMASVTSVQSRVEAGGEAGQAKSGHSTRARC